jgi:uncharacterized protein (TIGR02266 family)
MSDYWISDAEGRVLGPVGLVVLKDLLEARRITQVTRVSLDGQAWQPLQSVPELQRLWADQDPQGRRVRQQQEAARLRAHLDACRPLPPHGIFGVAKDAPKEAFREAYFRISKRFHPDKVPEDAEPELRDVCALAFHFYTAAMNRVEANFAATTPPPPVTPAYDPEAFVGIREAGPRAAEAEIHVTPQNAGMFTDHPLMNLRRGGFFLADKRVLPLGTTLSLTFRFDEPPRTLAARGKVVWEDAGRPGVTAGFGVSFVELSEADRDFLLTFVQQVQAAASRAGGRHR